MILITREIKSILNVHEALVNTELGNLACKYLSSQNLEWGSLEVSRKQLRLAPWSPQTSGHFLHRGRWLAKWAPWSRVSQVGLASRTTTWHLTGRRAVSCGLGGQQG